MKAHAATHSRHYEYAGSSAALLQELSGLEALRAMIAGQIAPPSIAATLGFGLTACEVGFAQFEGTPLDFALNPAGSVHGGYCATLLDSALGCAVHSTLAAGVGYTTVDLHVTFVRGLRPDAGKVIAEARVTHSGARIATAEGRVVRASDNKLVAHGLATCMLLGPEPERRP